MKQKILVCYKSVTGFTEDYARSIAQALNSELMELKTVTQEIAARYDAMIFGGRCHAGCVDGLKRARALTEKAGVGLLAVFAVGAMPHTAAETIEELWKNNLTPEELTLIPHFYLPGGLRYEKMPIIDRWMMRAFSAIIQGRLKKGKARSSADEAMAAAIAHSYDISGREYIKPLVDCLRPEK